MRVTARVPLTLEQGEEEDSSIATGHTGFGELCVVVTLLTRLNEGEEGQNIVRERQHVRDGTLACRNTHKISHRAHIT